MWRDATLATDRTKIRRVSASDYRLLAEFRHLLRGFLAFSEDAARRAGLTPQQHQTLLAIKGYEGSPTVGQLAQRLLIRHHSAVGLADRLARAGLLARNIDPDDRRRVTLTLTAKAERVLARLSTAHRDELRRLAPMLREILARL
jgi:DNA-binding MarR family transcriptional regulator